MTYINSSNFIKAVKFIYQNLDEPITLELIAKKLNNMGLAYHYIYGAWLNKTSVKIDDTKPAFMMMDKFPNNFEESRVSIYVPIVNC